MIAQNPSYSVRLSFDESRTCSDSVVPYPAFACESDGQLAGCTYRVIAQNPSNSVRLSFRESFFSFLVILSARMVFGDRLARRSRRTFVKLLTNLSFLVIMMLLNIDRKRLSCIY